MQGNSPTLPPALVIEDELMIAWQTEDLLRSMGFENVQIAAGLSQALAMAAEVSPGLILCDINLGSSADGLATAAALRAMDKVPLLFVTGYAGEEIESQVLGEFPDAQILRKPIEAGALQRAVSKVLKLPAA